MIKRDLNGFIVDDTMDGGDSANRAGLMVLFGEKIFLSDYLLFNSKHELDSPCTRHPYQRPWNNPKNFSRDQLIPFVAGLWRQNRQDLVRKIFYAHIKRFFFCQNFERDWPGTTKYPWPHKVDGKWRMFDFADPLLPDHIWHLILCGKIWPLYWFGIIGYPWLILSIMINAMGSSNDQGQIISQCVVAGRPFVRFYKWRTVDWKKRLATYWYFSRNQREIEIAIRTGIENI